MKKIMLFVLVLAGCAITQLPKNPDPPEPEDNDCIIGLTSCGHYCCNMDQACIKSKKTGQHYCSNK